MSPVPTQSPSIVLRVPIVCQLLPTRKSVCYISNNNIFANVGRVTTVSRVNPRPQSLGRTEKLFFQFIFFSGVFLVAYCYCHLAYVI